MLSSENHGFKSRVGIQHCCSVLHHFPRFSDFQNGYFIASLTSNPCTSSFRYHTLSYWPHFTRYWKIEDLPVRNTVFSLLQKLQCHLLLFLWPLPSLFWTLDEMPSLPSKAKPPLGRWVPFSIGFARTICLKFYTFPLHSQFIPLSWITSISIQTCCNITYICFWMSSWELHIFFLVFFDCFP